MKKSWYQTLRTTLWLCVGSLCLNSSPLFSQQNDTHSNTYYAAPPAEQEQQEEEPEEETVDSPSFSPFAFFSSQPLSGKTAGRLKENLRDYYLRKESSGRQSSPGLYNSAISGRNLKNLKKGMRKQYKERAPYAAKDIEQDDESFFSKPSFINSESPYLTGLLLVGDPDLVKPKVMSTVDGVETLGLEVPGGQQQLASRLLPYFYKQTVNQEGMNQITQVIYEYYHKHGRPIVYVSIPAQNISRSTLQIIVAEGTVGKITYSGNQHFKTEVLERYVRLRKGAKIDGTKLRSDLNLMNHNPFRTTDVIFSQVDEAGKTNVEFLTKDRKTTRYYVGADNTGYRDTGYNRWFAGFNLSNLFGADQSLDYQCITGDNLHSFFGNTLKYTAPLPCAGHFLVLYGNYTKTSWHWHHTCCRFNGMYGQASLRYEMPFPTRSVTHALTLGCDYKRYNNGFSPSGYLVIGKTLNLFQLAAEYKLGWDSPRATLSSVFEVFYSPGQWLPDQSDGYYQSIIPYSGSHYVYGRIAITPTIKLPKRFALCLDFRGQLANTTLPASESFDIGGYSAVRGYVEHQMNGDNAFVGNVELRFPSFRLLDVRKIRDSLTFLAFVDYGHIWNIRGQSAEIRDGYLLGVGPGLRYLISPYLSVRADYGFQLHRPEFNAQFHHRFHFNCILSY